MRIPAIRPVAKSLAFAILVVCSDGARQIFSFAQVGLMEMKMLSYFAAGTLHAVLLFLL